jgi:hypothetical protein
MAAETQIIIVDYQQNAKTGYITVLVKSHTVDGGNSWDGPVMPYGVDTIAFKNRFGGDIAQFEAWVVAEHKSLTGANVTLTAALEARKGKVIG